MKFQKLKEGEGIRFGRYIGSGEAEDKLFSISVHGEGIEVIYDHQRYRLTFEAMLTEIIQEAKSK